MEGTDEPISPGGLAVNEFLFTSESVGEGQSDKLCDQVSDAILDECLKIDPETLVNIEVSAKGKNFIVLGSIGTVSIPDFKAIVQETVKQAGFDCEERGFDANDIEVINLVKTPELEYTEEEKFNFSKDTQGTVIGYATDEWDSEILNPLSHYLASRICERLSECRRLGIIPWLRPDCKSQVTVQYKKEANLLIPLRIDNVLVSTQHNPYIEYEALCDELKEKVINFVIPAQFVDEKTKYYINPSKSFTIGGPKSDTGMTGHKITVDTYGGWIPSVGAAFSGKHPFNIDRSGSYYARFIAKSLVYHKLCHRVQVQISYTPEFPDPFSIYVDSFNTVKEGLTDEDLLNIIRKNFNFRLPDIIAELNLLNPIYSKTAVFGHFGRILPEFTWEVPKEKLIL